MSEFGWAIVGPGRIAHRFADAVDRLPGMRLAAVQGRDRARAAEFARHWSRPEAPRVLTDIDALLREAVVDAVYIATPHAFHFDTVDACLRAGKPVLCEKPMTVNADQARQLSALSRQRGVFLMEALWTRFLPVYETVGDWLASGSIGRLRGLQSSFCFDMPVDPRARTFDLAQAGGSLLDLGVYNLSMSQWALKKAQGACPALEELTVHGEIGPTGVDQRVAATLWFAGGVACQFQCGFDSHADNALRVFGEHGTIAVPQRFWEATSATMQLGDSPAETVQRPFAINGFEGEIAEATRCILRGDIESPVMPQADTVAVAGWMDRIRESLGLRYPFE